MRPRDQSAPRHRRPGLPRTRPLAAGLAVAVALGACLTGVVLAAAEPHPGPAEGPAGRSAAGLLAASAGPEPSGDARARSCSGRTPTPGRGPVVRAAAVLRTWDAQRARAWAEADLAALRGLYVDGAGAADVRLLRRYAERGYRVEGLTTQLLAVDVLDRAPDRWRLRVTDRVAHGVAVGDGERRRLPRDRADTRLVVLTRGADGAWRVAEVRPARR